MEHLRCKLGYHILYGNVVSNFLYKILFFWK